ncbi:hypothetical protein GCM10007301_19840 [Azorhizobium oxalatiphilum]|uniref:HTH merR-type domain-containing protein n=1 Tax=Azorhizobium oxalatiphilum TaxID=980631 RepID=A0A917F9N3_9HYPH|nr:hypothetical protein GCM10007301_19840 [Azorhizobium oxalatiphilum]
MVDARNLDKSPDAFRTISEVADELDLPQHVLRFWETKFTQIRPVKRAGGRRYYRPDDVELLRGIRHLLYRDGYTIKGVQKILKDQGVRHVQAVAYDDGEPAPAPVEATAPRVREEGGGISGLLGGLLPRRRATDKLADNPSRGAPADEPPLPFPDFASFTPRTEEQAPPRRPKAEPPVQPAPARSEPSFDAPDFHEPVLRERDAALFDEPEFHARPLTEPSLAPAANRRPASAPLQRPSRGPASRVPERPAAPELEDPLLPFFDDEEPDAQENASEPLDARIRRLKEATPAPEPPVAEERGPPEEYIPARARKRPAEPPPAAAPAPPLHEARVPARPEPVFEADLSDEDMDAEDEMGVPPEPDTWRGGRPVAGDDRMRDPRAGSYAAPRAPARAGPDVHDDWPEDEPYLRAPQPGRAPDRGPTPLRADRTPPADPFFDGPPAAYGRLGPLRGPLEEYDPAQEMPRPAGADHGLRADRRDHYAADPRWPEQRPAAPPHDGRYTPAHGAPDHAAYGQRPREDRHPSYERRPEPQARSGAGWEPEDAESWDGQQYTPPEPHRPGPPEQYLPPHLRSEPRLSGAPQPPAPILSRDDVSRLQAALFELSECRRIITALGSEPRSGSE